MESLQEQLAAVEERCRELEREEQQRRRDTELELHRAVEGKWEAHEALLVRCLDKPSRGNWIESSEAAPSAKVRDRDDLNKPQEPEEMAQTEALLTQIDALRVELNSLETANRWLRPA